MHSVRRDVGDDVQGIVASAKTLTDWRHYAKHHPWLCLGAAFAAGYVLVPARKAPMSDQARELADLLKKANRVAAGVPSESSIGKKLFATAAPLLVRGALSMATQRFSSGPGRSDIVMTSDGMTPS